MLSKVTAKLKLHKKKLWLNSPKNSPLLFSLHIILLAGISLFLFVLLFIIAKYFIFETPSATHTIVFSQEGFTPQDITIKKGDTVIFRNESENQMWPASNLHPSHGIYPEFDPKKPIENGASWQFTFNKEGKWKYHDHLSSFYTGFITVNGSDKMKSTTYNPENCEKLDTSGKEKCWEDLLDSAIKEEGLPKAYDLFEYFFQEDPLFAQNCHGFTHKLGEKAFYEFQKNENFPVTEQVAACSYGFFHGFIETMMHTDGTLDDAREFCTYIDNKLKGKTTTTNACLHGIGHGITEDDPDPKKKGNIQSYINPGLEICEKIGKNEHEVHLCGTGVFNALAGMLLNPKYELPFDENDPFWICRQQTKSIYKQACYTDFKALIYFLQDGNFERSIHFIRDNVESEYAPYAMDNITTFSIYFLFKDDALLKDAAQKCQNLKSNLTIDCINGLGAGLMTAGIPGKEYEKALEFCGSGFLTTKEKDSCHGRIISGMYYQYAYAKAQKICSGVDMEYKKYCQNRIN